MKPVSQLTDTELEAELAAFDRKRPEGERPASKLSNSELKAELEKYGLDGALREKDPGGDVSGLGQAVKRGFDNAVGERFGIDPDTNAEIGRIFGPNAAVVAPLANVARGAAEVFEIPLRALTELGAENLKALGLADRVDSTADDLNEFADMATLVLGMRTPASLSPARKIPKANQTASQNLEVVEAAERQGVTVLPADVGGAGVKRATSAAAQSPLSASTINKAAKANVQSFEEAVDRTADQAGQVRDITGMGEAAQDGALAYRTQSSAQAEKLYNKAFDLVGEGRIQPENTVKLLQEQIEQLSISPKSNASQIKALRDVLSDLTDDQGNVQALPVRAVRDIRTLLRNSMSQSNVAPSAMDRRLTGVSTAIGEDIERGLRGNPQALKAFKDADAFWAERSDTLKNALSKIIGQKESTVSAEAAGNAIVRLAGKTGDSNKLMKTLNALPNDARGDVVASLVNNLGRRSPGADFSVSTFVTQYQKMTPRSKSALFKSDLRAALDDLETVGAAMQETQRFANNSNTGSVAVTAGTVGAAINDISTGFALALSQITAGRALTSPRFVRLLTRSERLKKRGNEGGDIRNATDRLLTDLSRFVAANDNAAIGVGDPLAPALRSVGSEETVGQGEKERKNN